MTIGIDTFATKLQQIVQTSAYRVSLLYFAWESVCFGCDLNSDLADGVSGNNFNRQ